MKRERMLGGAKQWIGQERRMDEGRDTERREKGKQRLTREQKTEKG